MDKLLSIFLEKLKYYDNVDEQELSNYGAGRRDAMIEFVVFLKDAIDNQWQPIETAPLKKWILVVDECGQVKTEFFKEGFEFSFFVYWQPLPQPPKENKNE